jgi:hypothetical protein
MINNILFLVYEILFYLLLLNSIKILLLLYGSRCLEVMVPTVFNSIPVELRNLRRLSLVKKLIKEWLLLSDD